MAFIKLNEIKRFCNEYNQEKKEAYYEMMSLFKNIINEILKIINSYKIKSKLEVK